MNLDEAICGRRAVREYTDRKVERQHIQKIINLAVQAPSAVNRQPWAFTVVTDQPILDLVSAEAKAHMIATAGDNRDANHFRQHLEDPAFQIFYHAPVLILISALEAGPWIVEDCSLAAQNLMLAAYELGLGSCWIGFAQSFLNTKRGKNLLRLPDPWVAVAPVIVGYPGNFPIATQRNEPVVRWLG